MQMLVGLRQAPRSKYVDVFLACSKTKLDCHGWQMHGRDDGSGLSLDAKDSEDGKRDMLAIGLRALGT